MGYQPGLDGLRAISVIAVILYHAGFGWMHGGFLGVEVFFVVSGYLITSLLIEEREKTGASSAAAVLDASCPSAVAGPVRRARSPSACGSRCSVPAQQQSDLHRDYLPGIFYFANWGQIFGGAQYFGNFSPLRHLWSLAVEEQWYLLWPLAFVLITRRNKRNVEVGRSILVAALAVMVITWWLASPTRVDIGPHQLLVPVDADAIERLAARRRRCIRVASMAGQGRRVESLRRRA